MIKIFNYIDKESIRDQPILGFLEVD